MAKPIEKLKSGSLEACIWKNEVEKDGKTLTFYSVTIAKNYKDKKNKWKKSNNYNFNELLAVGFLAEKAYEFLAKYDNSLVKK